MRDDGESPLFRRLNLNFGGALSAGYRVCGYSTLPFRHVENKAKVAKILSARHDRCHGLPADNQLDGIAFTSRSIGDDHFNFFGQAPVFAVIEDLRRDSRFYCLRGHGCFVVQQFQRVIGNPRVSGRNRAGGELRLIWIVDRRQHKCVASFAQKPCRDADALFIARSLRHKCAFPVAGGVVQRGMKVNIALMAVDCRAQIREARRFIENREMQGVLAARSLCESELDAVGMQAAAGYRVRRTRLKGMPVLCTATADDKVHVGGRRSVVDPVARKFTRRVVEAADAPDRLRLSDGDGGACS